MNLNCFGFRGWDFFIKLELLVGVVGIRGIVNLYVLVEYFCLLVDFIIMVFDYRVSTFKYRIYYNSKFVF